MDCDDWPAAAAKDDTMVADLLLKLKRSAQTSTRRESKTKVTGLIQFRWGRRKARTRPDVTRFAMSKEFKERANRSPTTPLSWSTGGCGTTSVSGSGNVDGFEASSMMCGRANGSRSKITAASAYELVNDKKAKRKKTYSELKKEERLLLDEKLHLKRDLANMHASLTHHRNTNQNLKRIKSMNVHSRTVTPSITQHPVSCAHIQTLTTEGLIFKFQDSNSNNEIPQPSFSSNNVSGTKDNKSLTLPDLNMLPATE